jgi:glycosyltransferase involved in cell wall biosynthesis
VIVPTRDEAANVRPLLARLASSIGDAVAEVLFVDDSSDGTADAIRTAGRQSGMAVRLIHRGVKARRGGLSAAVVLGLTHARGTWAVVMDGDLQHPPELVARMVAIGQARGLDLVVGSR